MVNIYLRLLCGGTGFIVPDTFAARLARAFHPDDFRVIFGDPGQMSLFGPAAGAIRAVLNRTDRNDECL